MKKLVFELEIYTYQIDFVGHVSNIVYIQWMEIGRTKLLEYIGLPITSISESGIVPILIHTSIKYKKALYLHDKVKIEIWISELTNLTAVIKFNFYNSKGELAAFSEQTGLMINKKNLKPHRLTIEERTAFEKILIKE